MKIAIIALGTQGDVQPYIALGTALKFAGHTVRLMTHENFEPAVKASNLEFWSMQGNVQNAIQTPEMGALLEKGNFLEINRYAAKLMQDAALHWALDSLSATQGMQLLIAGIGGLFLARALSEKLNLPLIEAYVVPFTPTREFPGPLFPKSVSRLGGVANRFTHHLVQQAVWQGFRAGDRAMRQEVLNLPPAPFFGPRPRREKFKPPVLYGISSTVIPKPADWNTDVYLTGYWLLNPQSDWQPPADLEAFLQAGPPPVYIGFGSMGNRNPKQTTELVLDALKLTGQRAVLLKGWGGMIHGTLQDLVYLSDAIPHTWLFPRMAAVIHHGGAGTTAAGLRAGVPNVVIPFFGDQPFWGGRVQALGVGPAPIPRKHLTTEQLAQAIQIVTTNEMMQQKAAQLGAAIREENGLQNAVRLIEEYGHQKCGYLG